VSASIRLDVSELRRDLAALGEAVAEETDRIVAANASLFAADLPSRYPAADGDLRDGVRMKRIAPRVYVVKSTARHAHLFELGTVRRFSGETGANRGSMPAKPTFVPWAIRWRERMIEQITSYVRAVKTRGFSGSLGGQA